MKRTSVYWLGFFFLFPALFAPRDAFAENFGQWIDRQSQDCANGSVGTCSYLQNHPRQAREPEAFQDHHQLGPQIGDDNSKTQRWLERARSKIDQARASGLLGGLGMFGGGNLVSEVESILNTVQQFHGDIGAALRGSNLLGQVLSCLSGAKRAAVGSGLTNGSEFDAVAGAIPGLASQLENHQISIGQAFASLESTPGAGRLLQEAQSLGGSGLLNNPEIAQIVHELH